MRELYLPFKPAGFRAGTNAEPYCGLALRLTVAIVRGGRGDRGAAGGLTLRRCHGLLVPRPEYAGCDPVPETWLKLRQASSGASPTARLAPGKLQRKKKKKKVKQKLGGVGGTEEATAAADAVVRAARAAGDAGRRAGRARPQSAGPRPTTIWGPPKSVSKAGAGLGAPIRTKHQDRHPAAAAVVAVAASDSRGLPPGDFSRELSAAVASAEGWQTRYAAPDASPYAESPPRMRIARPQSAPARRGKKAAAADPARRLVGLDVARKQYWRLTILVESLPGAVVPLNSQLSVSMRLCGQRPAEGELGSPGGTPVSGKVWIWGSLLALRQYTNPLELRLSCRQTGGAAASTYAIVAGTAEHVGVASVVLQPLAFRGQLEKRSQFEPAPGISPRSLPPMRVRVAAWLDPLSAVGGAEEPPTMVRGAEIYPNVFAAWPSVLHQTSIDQASIDEL
jgi:hypothetical protein